MRFILIFILLYFVGLNGLLAERVIKSTKRNFSHGSSRSKPKITGKKFFNHQTRRRTTALPLTKGEEIILSKIGDANNKYDDMLGEKPLYLDYEGNRYDREDTNSLSLQNVDEFPEYNYNDEPDDSDVENNDDSSELDREKKKAVQRQDDILHEGKLMPRVARRQHFKKYKSKSRGGQGRKRKKGKKYKSRYRSHKKKPSGYKRRKGFKKGRPKGFFSKKHKNKPPFDARGNNELQPFKKQEFNNRLFRKSVNDSNLQGISNLPADTTAAKIPELSTELLNAPTSNSAMIKRNDAIKRQVDENDLTITEEPPEELKPGAFKAEMFHERVMRNGTSGVRDDIIADDNDKLPLEKRQVVTNNPARRRRKHIETNYAMKRYLTMRKRRLVNKKANTTTSTTISTTTTTIPTTTTSTINDTTIIDAPQTTGSDTETEPPITGETEAPTTIMMGKRSENKRFVTPEFQYQKRDVNGHTSKMTKKEFENIFEQNGMHLVKLIYRIKEQELESIFDTLNISTSTEVGAGLTTENLEDVVKMQSSMIQQLVKAVDENQNGEVNTKKHHPAHKKEINHHNSSRISKSNAPQADIDSKNYYNSGKQKRFQTPRLASSGILNADTLQNVLQLYQQQKSKNNQESSDDPRSPISAPKKPVTEIIMKNILKNPAFLQQLLSKNSNIKSGLLSPSMLQLMASSLLESADKVEKNELIDKDKSIVKDNQGLGEKSPEMFGDNSKVATSATHEKASQTNKNFPSSEGSSPRAEEKKLNADKIKQILNEILKNPSVVRRSNVYSRKARESLLKPEQIVAKALGLAPKSTNQNNASVNVSNMAPELSNKDSVLSELNNNATDITVEDADEDEEDSTSNLPGLKTSPIIATTVADYSEDGDDDSTVEGDEAVEMETLTENDTTLPTEHS